MVTYVITMLYVQNYHIDMVKRGMFRVTIYGYYYHKFILLPYLSVIYILWIKFNMFNYEHFEIKTKVKVEIFSSVYIPTCLNIITYILWSRSLFLNFQIFWINITHSLMQFYKFMYTILLNFSFYDIFTHNAISLEYSIIVSHRY